MIIIIGQRKTIMMVETSQSVYTVIEILIYYPKYAFDFRFFFYHTLCSNRL